VDLDNPERLTAIGRQIRAAVLQTHGLDSCIYTTALTLHLLRALGQDAYALSVRAVIMNEPMARIMDERGAENVSRDDSDVLAAGGYALGLGYAPDGIEQGRWPGHLVAILNRRWLLDFSIDQASRPQYGIPLDDVLVGPIDEAAQRGHGLARYELRSEGVLLRVDYMAHTGDRTYRTSPDWKRGIENEFGVSIQ
jgi:hypothetical protein